MNLVNSKTLIQSNFILNLNNYHKNFINILRINIK